MENKKKDKDKMSRINIIDEIFNRFKVVNSLNKYDEENIESFQKKNEFEIDNINGYFESLKTNEIAYILYSFRLSNERKNDNIINFLDTMNSIVSHFEYYKIKNPNIKYNNSHFDNYLLKRYDCSYIFTTYLSEMDCRELKIDNKLYFNYIPIKCYEKHSEDPSEKEKCGFAHNEIELRFHPFVYKKFKCNILNCKKDSDCNLYHTNNDDGPIDMETEVDFDSDEIIKLQKILSSLNFSKKEKDNNKDSKLNSLDKQKKDYIPTEFNPLTYKRYKCPLGSICKLDNKLCLNYHNEKDRRRNPNLYEASLCPNLYKNNKRIKGGKCDFGDDCKKAHNLFEYFYHPDKFRKLKCKQEDEENG